MLKVVLYVGLSLVYGSLWMFFMVVVYDFLFVVVDGCYCEEPCIFVGLNLGMTSNGCNQQDGWGSCLGSLFALENCNRCQLLN